MPRSVLASLSAFSHSSYFLAMCISSALAREAFAHLLIETHYPRSPGDDWNDVLRARLGLDGEN